MASSLLAYSLWVQTLSLVDGATLKASCHLHGVTQVVEVVALVQVSKSGMVAVRTSGRQYPEPVGLNSLPVDQTQDIFSQD
jgi:hypothetical protein